MPSIDTELITTREASEMLGEGVRQTIRRVERDELAPAKKLPGLRGSYLFNRSDIEALKSTPASDATPSQSGAGASSVRRAS